MLVDALCKEEILLKQKSRVNWLKLGDANNKFFFNSCNGRWNTNKILSLVDDEGTVHTTHRDISSVAVNYFEATLGSETHVEPIDPEVVLPCISTEQQSSLSRNFSSTDILNGFKHMAKNKCPGPDGFTAEFYIAAWGTIGNDVIAGILHFFDTLHLPRIINSTAIALVPKTDCPSHIIDFRPISCCNTIYKCISRLLASRLQKILPSYISKNQTAFIKQRSIGDNVMLAQAICRDYHRDSGIPRCALKLDMHKAFDTMNWRFLFQAMQRMGFPQKFISWVRQCISTSMISVKVNGGAGRLF